jgi:hypothetical protein
MKMSKTVVFPMYFEVCGMQKIVLPDYIDANDEDAIKEYIDDNWDHIKLPDDYEYVGDNGFDYECEIEVIDDGLDRQTKGN